MNSISEQDIRAKLEELAEVRAAAEITRLDYEAKRTELLRSIQDELDALKAEYDPLLTSADERATALEAEVKQAVALYGASVKGSMYHAVYNRGRIAWNTPELDQYAQSHPEILLYRKEGEPSVSLRTVKSGSGPNKTDPAP